ncbi:MAG: c-type cytochrome [Cytophagales bacterium]|nr:c-type cytochrome [Cytophagales bacterium]
MAQEAPASGPSTDPAVIAAGESLFKANCAVCHAVHEKVVGPALKDVHQRRPLPWILNFVRNSQKVIQGGDEYAVNLYNQYNKTEMPAFDFKDEEISSIVAYVAQESAKTPQAAAPAATPGDGAEVSTTTDQGIPASYFTILLAVLIVILVLIFVVLVLISVVLTRYLKDKADLNEADRELLDQKFDILAILKSQAFIGIVGLIFTALVLKGGIDWLFSIGVQQGYAPTQPIAFSHKIHAGQYKIDCNYCHTGVRKSKNANIPSPNICMNCHSQIKTESPEILKIYAAIEEQKPIEWVRIHNLPDLAYFNHEQHVSVGQLECQTCHGPIEEMDVVKQHTTLTMGWCINCHRNTEIKTDGNAYYDNLVEIHQETSKEPMKVDDIGGLECSKCHY